MRRLRWSKFLRLMFSAISQLEALGVFVHRMDDKCWAVSPDGQVAALVNARTASVLDKRMTASRQIEWILLCPRAIRRMSYTHLQFLDALRSDATSPIVRIK